MLCLIINDVDIPQKTRYTSSPWFLFKAKLNLPFQQVTLV